LRLPKHKTRIVCTIGPASQSPGTLERMMRQGMDVARLNLAHGDIDSHRSTITSIRQAAERVGRRVALLADLPGPKLRVGRLPGDQMELERGQVVRLVAFADGTADDSTQLSQLPEIPFNLPTLPASLKAGDDVFLDDGLIQLRIRDDPAQRARPGGEGRGRLAKVLLGGTLRSRDGIALPGIDLDIPAFTTRDRDLLAFALAEGIDAVGISFVQGPEDVAMVRAAANSLGADPFIIAKIERARAMERVDSILELADGLMVARGDLGVDIPLERIAIAQKTLIGRANAAGRPVITATQMLESMTVHRRPTRAEVTDVSNAILDGTDCVMLSEETAMGRHPVEAVATMRRVAEATERHLSTAPPPPSNVVSVAGVLAQQAAVMADRLNVPYIIAPTETGATARAIARVRPRAWIIAFSPSEEACRRLQFSRGVYPVFVRREVDWHGIARRWCEEQGLKPGLAILIQDNRRLEVIDLATRVGDRSAAAPLSTTKEDVQ